MEEVLNNPTIIYNLNKEALETVLQKIVDAAIEKHFEKPKEEKLLTIRQVCDLLDVNKSTLWHWHKEGYLKKIYIGGKPRYKESEVMAIREGRQ
jgi:excisionase family DNA binding protein